MKAFCRLCKNEVSTINILDEYNRGFLRTCPNCFFVIAADENTTTPIFLDMDFSDGDINSNRWVRERYIRDALNKTNGIEELKRRNEHKKRLAVIERRYAEGRCIECGRKLTHPVSVGLKTGPVCGNHGYNKKLLEEIFDKHGWDKSNL